MNLQQLETFLWLARLQSFTRTAQRLNATQSTISMRVSDLERELGVQLVDRSQRQIHITGKGLDLMVYAERMHKLVSDIRSQVGDPAKIGGTIRIAAAELVALTWLPGLVSRLNALYPGSKVELEVGLRGTSHSRLKSGELQLCILPVFGAETPGFEYTSLGEVDFRFMASPGFDRGGNPFSPADIAGLPLIMLGPNSVVAELQLDWFRRNGVTPGTVTQSNSMEISAGLVRSGLGVSFLPLDYYAADIAAGRMICLETSPAISAVPFCVIQSANAPSYVDDITTVIKEVVRSLDPPAQA
ncbi:LysR family transcriptional regulator [Roseovarius ramblicola]|uniref:LysR family transcriptional regulator n=1 Tax=Roseovarius ramblicola TaxID=2022336 RepID=A0ABV5I3G7_9RHOB